MQESFDNLEDGRLASRHFKWLTHFFSLITVAGLTAGVYANMTGHEIAYGVYREVPWGIVISTFAFFAITSTGLCLMAAISHAYGVTPLEPLGNRALYLSIVTTVSAFALLAFGVESPWGLLYYNAVSPSLTSNIWWMCTLYGIMSGCLFLRFAFLISGMKGLAFSLGIFAAVVGVGANNNLGGLFTIASDPPIWFGVQLLVHFLASAVLSGTAAIIIFTMISFKIRNQRIREETFKALETAATIMCLMIGIVLVVTVARFWSMFYGSSSDPGRIAAQALVSGPLVVNFWLFEILLGLVAPLALLLITKISNGRAMMAAAGLALTGAFFQRFDLVMSGQIIPKLAGWNDLPEYFHYFPTVAEFIVVLGAFGLVAFGFLLGERFVGKLFRLY